MPLATPFGQADPSLVPTASRGGRIGAGAAQQLERTTALAARMLRAPVALLWRIEGGAPQLECQAGESSDWVGRSALALALARETARSPNPLAVRDVKARSDAVMSETSAHYRGFLGAALRWPDGEAAAVLGVFDHGPRAWTDYEASALEDLTALAQLSLERIAPASDQHATAHDTVPVGAQLSAATPHLTEEELWRSLDDISVGVGLLDLDGRFLRVNRVLCHMVGHSAEELSRLNFREIVQEDAVAAQGEQYQSLLEGRISAYELTKQFWHQDLRVVDASVHVSLAREDGKPKYCLALCKDITESNRRKAELEEKTHALREQTALVRLLEAVAVAANEATSSRSAMQLCLELVCEYMAWPIGHAFLVEGTKLLPSDLMYLADPDRFALFREVTARTHLVKGLGLPGQAFAVGKPTWMEDVQTDPGFVRSKAAVELSVRGGIALPVHAGGEPFAVLEFYSESPAVIDARTLEIMQHVGAQLGRVAERERHAEMVRSLSLTDELTGLHNRRGFFAAAEPHLRIAARARRESLLLFLDMDGLKQINDQLGHDAGDQAITDMARVLRSTFRESDVIARLGGDEFVVLLPDASAAHESALAGRLQEAMTLHNLRVERDYVLAASVGVTPFDSHQPIPLEELLRRADELMYKQKRARKEAGGSASVVMRRSVRS